MSTIDDVMRLIDAYVSQTFTRGPLLNGKARAALRAAIEALAVHGATPEGWVLVPAEPSKEMHNAGGDVGCGIGGSPPPVSWIYRAMIKAAPPAPVRKWERLTEDEVAEIYEVSISKLTGFASDLQDALMRKNGGE
jgi:hypothetical protein